MQEKKTSNRAMSSGLCRICAAMLMLTLISCHVISGTMAKYVSSSGQQNSDDARVASFSVNASGNSSDALSMIYGESADYTLNIKNDSEVAVRYQVIISFADDVSDKLAVALGTATPQNGVYNSSENKTVFTFTDSGFCLNVGEEVSKNLVITAKASFLPDENTKVESLSENYGFDTQVLFEQID